MRLRGSILSRVCFVYSIVSCGLLLGGVPGTLKWSFPTGNAIQGSPAIGPNGVIYVGSRDRTLYAVNPDGTERWSFTAPGQFVGPVAIADDGTILAADDEGNVHALDPEDGSARWTFATGLSRDPSEMAIAEDGTVYVAFGSDYFAINPDGTQFWTISRPAESLVTGISIGPEGVVLSVTQSRLIALDPLPAPRNGSISVPSEEAG